MSAGPRRKPISAGTGCLIIIGIGIALSTFRSPRAPSASEPDCLAVGSHLTGSLGAPLAMAVRYSIPRSPGVARNGLVWFVATPAGAIWVTDVPPNMDQSGLILPLNAAARAHSEIGVDISADAPVYAGITDSHEGAQAARSCAAGK